MERFLFDTSFDNEGAETDEDAPAISEQELTQAREAAFLEGEAAGRAAAQAAAEQQAADAAAQVLARVDALERAQAEHNVRLAEEALELAAAICAKALPAAAERHALEEIENLVRTTLASLLEEPRIVVRVADTQVDPLKQRLDAAAATVGYEGSIVLLGDDTLVPTDCAVLWADGGAERSLETLLASIDEAVARMHNQLLPGTAGAAADPATHDTPSDAPAPDAAAPTPATAS